MRKINKCFKSDIDEFLENFDKQNPVRSFSQQKEEMVFATLNQLRDFPISAEVTFKLWDSF